MLNFREELSKIKESKTKPMNFYEEVVDNILKKLLQYIDTKDVSVIEEGVKVSFQITGCAIYAQEYENSTPILVEVLASDAELVLYYLEDKLIKEEGFERASENIARRNNIFDTIIKA